MNTLLQTISNPPPLPRTPTPPHPLSLRMFTDTVYTNSPLSISEIVLALSPGLMCDGQLQTEMLPARAEKMDICVPGPLILLVTQIA